MERKYFENRVKSLTIELKKNKRYLTICTIDEMLKDGNIDNVTFAKNKIRDVIYMSGEFFGTSIVLKPRFKISICTLNDFETLSKDELKSITLLKMRKGWKMWLEKYCKNDNPLSNNFQKEYMGNLDRRFMRDCFETIDI